jgi:predicted ATPase/DNA-binding CsgD family transcriptional regulator
VQENGPVATQSSAAAGISPREAEVLALVGEHRSNAEIGARLFISVRTVETHVSSLLHKLGVPDRRALALVAGELARAERSTEALASLPSPLTSFIGRTRERAALGEAIRANRLVTAVGPGGVGKTRLAVAVATDALTGFADSMWFVDLVPVSDPAMVAGAVAAALGIGEQQGRNLSDSVVTALADRHALLVLDNCEHVRDGVTPLIERLLAGCPRLTVLATSRARLMVPFEHVFAVPPLSLDGDGGEHGGEHGDRGEDRREPDAVALFMDRAAAAGWPVAQEQRGLVTEVCRELDGIALAIELAAARLPTLGLDGLVAGLADHLRLLVGGRRADERHGSVRAMLDWSAGLLTKADLTVFRRIAVFVAPFTVEAAAEVAEFTPLERSDAVAAGLARLAEQSLLVAAPSSGSIRYRALEAIRQYGMEQLVAAGDLGATRSRHLRWCLATAAELVKEAQPEVGTWRVRFDDVADDIRAALSWAADQPDRRGEARALALALADLAFARNLAGESQQRYEQAASLTDDPAAAVAALRSAAGVAASRMRGDDTYRLCRAAADVARRAGDAASAARDLATAATAFYRMSGVFDRLPLPGEAAALLVTARELAGDDPAAKAAVALAECGVLGDAFYADQAAPQTTAAETTALAERAVELARQLDDPLAECAALDALTGAQHLAGDSFAAAATARRRVDMLASVPVTPTSADELIDTLVMAVETSIGVGDLHAARRWGRQLRDLPLLAEVGHFATSRLLVAEALAGDVEGTLVDSDRFLDGWTQSGRPRAPSLGAPAAAVAMVHGLRGDDAARARWLAIVDELGVPPERKAGYGPTFDAFVLLHRGQATLALERLAVEPDEPAPSKWLTWIWLHWYMALRAEAAVLAADPQADRVLAAASAAVAGNPVATAIVNRAAALLGGDRPQLLAAGAAFDAAGCPYQAARALVLAGGEEAERGAAALTDLGLAPVETTPRAGPSA